jgi:DNA-binding MarR family transcriptional regulator
MVGAARVAEQNNPAYDEGQLASEFRLALMRLTRRIFAERSAELPPLSQLSALSTLLRFGPLSPTGLADLERIQPPSITRLTTMLEERGLVVRTPHPNDRRMTLLTITEAGEELLREERERRVAWLTVRIATLTPEEQRKLADVIPLIERLGASD